MVETADEKAGTATVYVVDDDPELCESVDWLLGSIGISPRICHSADEFLDAYSGDAPACIVLDVRMPRMSGTRLQEKLNEFAPHVAIIFVSAHGDIRMSVSTLQAGALDFLEKPYDPQRLLDAVQAGVETAVERFRTHALKRSVEGKVALLTPREREILRLRFFEGLTQREIAEAVGISQMHVSRLIRRTVDELRERIAVPAAA